MLLICSLDSDPKLLLPGTHNFVFLDPDSNNWLPESESQTYNFWFL